MVSAPGTMASVMVNRSSRPRTISAVLAPLASRSRSRSRSRREELSWDWAWTRRAEISPAAIFTRMSPACTGWPSVTGSSSIAPMNWAARSARCTGRTVPVTSMAEARSAACTVATATVAAGRLARPGESGFSEREQPAPAAATAAKQSRQWANFMVGEPDSGGRKGIEAKGAAEIDDREALVGCGDHVAETGVEEPPLGADQVGGQQGLLLEAGAGEGGAFLGLLDGAGRNRET